MKCTRSVVDERKKLMDIETKNQIDNFLDAALRLNRVVDRISADLDALEGDIDATKEAAKKVIPLISIGPSGIGGEYQKETN